MHAFPDRTPEPRIPILVLIEVLISVIHRKSQWTEWTRGPTEAHVSDLQRCRQTLGTRLLIRRFWVRIPGGAPDDAAELLGISRALAYELGA